MIKSQYNCCPLVWMFCSRKLKSMVNIVQERALRLTYKNNKNDFQTLLYENQWNICTPKKPAIFNEGNIYKIKNN